MRGCLLVCVCVSPMSSIYKTNYMNYCLIEKFIAYLLNYIATVVCIENVTVCAQLSGFPITSARERVRAPKRCRKQNRNNRNVSVCVPVDKSSAWCITVYTIGYIQLHSSWCRYVLLLLLCVCAIDIPMYINT